ncbi:hypothetical protein ALC57_12735, partial [Trachymyrmex cornetzi]
LNEITDIVLVLEECHNNYRQAAVLYRNRFPHRRYPNHCTISRLVLRQRQRQRQKRLRRNINVSERDDPTVLAILGMIAINPPVSTRQIERELGIILTTHNFHPYHITLTQQLTLNDFQQRLEFCRWTQIMLNRDRTFFRFVLFSDEATFHNTEQLNQHNSHYWSVENPRWYREVNHQHCGILNGNLIGPYFFDESGPYFFDENVYDNNYLHFTRQRMFFRQDGASAHWSRNHLDLTFPGRWIGRGGPVSKTPTTRENMMERITFACRSIPRNILLSAVDSFERQLCVDNNGQIFEHLLRS